MTDHEPQRSGSTAPDQHPDTQEPPAAPVVRLLANPRRVRRA
ncbi:hypothetical protein [Klenkia sp. PcliD-1-E]|nr:hypothetical protein [Klenkia sp. PcliD-1-E]